LQGFVVRDKRVGLSQPSQLPSLPKGMLGARQSEADRPTRLMAREPRARMGPLATEAENRDNVPSRCEVNIDE